MTKFVLDILQKEKNENLPYWLDHSQRTDHNSPERQAIRDKHRDRWLKEQKDKRWSEIIERAEALGMRVVDPPTDEAIKEALRFIGKDWDESKHPRVQGGPEGGEFTDGGGGGEDGSPDDQGGSGTAGQKLTKLDHTRLENWMGDGYRAMRYDKRFADTLAKLPKVTGKVFRGTRLNDADLKKLKTGSTYKIDKFSSSSQRRDAAQVFMSGAMHSPEKKVSVFFEIQDSGYKIPKKLAEEAGTEDEAEVILPIGDKYKIESVKKSGPTDEISFPHVVVKMKEVHAK